MSMSDSQVTQKLFRQFGLSAGASSVQSSAESGSYGRTEDMVSANQLGKLQCLVCMERVRRQDAVWSCSYCYHVFHLLCIQQWARRCEDNTKLLRMKEVFPDMDVSWYCPQCRGGFSVKRDGLPESYDCFCGKVRDPVDDKWVTPHSCGQLCEKPLAGACEHSCTLLCHPGPCPPCPQQVEMACFCGKTSSSRRCGEPGYTCGQQCRKVLSCGAHRCEAECHDGPCPPCTNTSLQTCRCGAVTERRPCAELDFTCGRVCGRPLPCGKHTCPLTCHDGDCASCPNEGARTCPCGRQPVDGIACDEPAPTCGETCDKELACGLHTCQRMCHHGDCGECTQLVNKQCACGRSTQSVPCSEEFKCKIKCRRMRNCGKHKCGQRCCVDCDACWRKCSNMLSCGNHRCGAPCHDGPCLRCPRTATISCRCGTTELQLRCGAEKLVDPPECEMRCRIPPDCHHRRSRPHPCHFGPCPPCKLKCGKRLPGCSHRCRNRCHSTAVKSSAPSAAPTSAPVWPALPAAPPTDADDEDDDPTRCPPCSVPVEVSCLGGHETVKVPCPDRHEPVACDRPCGRALACGNHSCAMACHDPESTPCRPCNAPCAKPRPQGVDGHDCPHACPRVCHPDECEPCAEALRLDCRCGTGFVFIDCVEYQRLSSAALLERRDCKQQCNRKLPNCAHLCPVVCHEGPCPGATTCTLRTKVACPCGRRKERWECSAVQAAQRERGVSEDHKALLECDAECRDRAQQTEREQEEAERLAREEEEAARRELEEQREAERQRREAKRAERKAKYLAKKRGEEPEPEPWWSRAGDAARDCTDKVRAQCTRRRVIAASIWAVVVVAIGWDFLSRYQR